MALKNDIIVTLSDGGIGRLASGKDYYTGVIFQGTKPVGYGTDSIKRVYSLAQAVGYGITEAAFPVEYYHVSEYFRILSKFRVSGFIDVMFSAIGTGLFDGTEITTICKNSNYELRQVGVFLIDPFASGFVTAANTKAQALDDAGYPVSVVLACDFANFTTPTDLKALDKKWVSTCIGQDGGGVGTTLFASEGYSITCLGAMLGTIAAAKVSENIGYVEKFDVSGVTELQTLALCDGTLVNTLTDAQIDALNDEGYTLLVNRRVAGSYFYDDPTGGIETSDYTYLSNVRAISKAKRLLLQYLAPLQNMPLFVNASTGLMNEQTIGKFTAKCQEALNNMAVNQELQVDQSTGRIPDGSISIDPTQNVLTTSKVAILVRIQPIGVARMIDVNLGFTVKNN